MRARARYSGVPPVRRHFAIFPVPDEREFPYGWLESPFCAARGQLQPAALGGALRRQKIVIHFSVSFRVFFCFCVSVHRGHATMGILMNDRTVGSIRGNYMHETLFWNAAPGIITIGRRRSAGRKWKPRLTSRRGRGRGRAWKALEARVSLEGSIFQSLVPRPTLSLPSLRRS